MTSLQTSKRFACDRCRDQKLRCPREASSRDDEPCARCLRAGALCVTSWARPLGRPARSAAPDNTTTATTTANNPPDYRFHRATSTSSSASRRPDPRLNRRVSRSTARTPRSVAHDPHGGTPKMNQDLFSIGPEGVSSRIGHDGSDLYGLPMEDDVWLGTGSPRLNEVVMGDFPPPAFDMPGMAPTRPTPIRSNSHNQTNHTHTNNMFRTNDLMEPFEEQGHALIPELDGDGQLPELPEGCDAVVWLASLNASIARQLAQVSTRPCDATWQATLGQMALSDDLHISPNAAAANPLGELLRSTSYFLSILRALEAPSSLTPKSPSLDPLDTSGPPSNGARPPPLAVVQSAFNGMEEPFSSLTAPKSVSQSLPCNSPTILMIVTTFLQLIRLYDGVFSRIHASLLEMPEKDVASFQALPGLRLGGFPLLQGHLHIKIIIQVLQHQLDLVERLMGLPAEYRLSTQHESCQGVFSHPEFLSLLRVAMGQNATSPESGGLQYVVSLKHNLQRVQQLLQ